MSKWYYRDGTLACDMSDPNWHEGMEKIEKLLGDIEYKRVNQTTLPNGMWVSTVWLGLDYGYPIFDQDQTNWKPMIFETMVFPKEGNFVDLDCQRYSTEKQALAGHKRMVKKWSKMSLGNATTAPE